jgi:glutamyl-Q tRNA(Asp) synthetase
MEQVDKTVGDFVLKRADGLWAYQLAVVVDDAAQGVNHVVRGEDLAASTAGQILLQRALGLSTPNYHHIGLLRDAQGRKISKQDGAAALVPGYAAVCAASHNLGLKPVGATLGEVLNHATQQWLTRDHAAGAPKKPAEPNLFS